ncbi:sigma 54-interacting transcriptional regulator [Limnochorda pilosa]|uniref:Fis family transcriptional regulator n=1 Tax=Limnochorda pilosa TaxID=1555112 RepID=A0A0K2SLG1_LIMPI|nr:sigma 54-interacting transcriptional regulator [Limnochorda pilosa]BAS27945.1 Fis family transcriptional regulator [Limnochorda pilosa]
MKAVIGLVAPYPDLVRMGQEVALPDEVTVHVREGDLDRGVEVARTLVDQGADVLVSRGGTALLVRRAVDVPVVEISVSGYDVLRAALEARRFSRRVALVGFPNVLYDAHVVGEALDLEWTEVTVRDASEVAEALMRAREQGAEVVVGDAISARTTEVLGMRGVLIRSGQRAVARALEHAVDVARTRRMERSRAEILHAILRQSGEGVVAVDRQGRVELLNPAAEQLFGRPAREAVGEVLPPWLEPLGLRESLERDDRVEGRLVRIQGSDVLVSREPLLVGHELIGAVATARDVTRLQRLEEQAQRQLRRRGHVARHTFDSIHGRAPGLRRAVDQAHKYAAGDATVLIQAETGTGKELFAHAIHHASRRRAGPFVAINCAALPENLLESELFGYDEGAFTGARKGGKPGLFEMAHHGTIFLDEIGEIPAHLQTRLLRVLENKEVMRVGGREVIPLDVRCIAATHVDLQERVRTGTFRADLFYRLNVLKLYIPPLRERLEDVPELVAHFLERLAEERGSSVRGLTRAAMRLLAAYEWPGNVRQLENVIERLTVLSRETQVSARAVRMILADETGPSAPVAPGEGSSLAEVTESIFWKVAEEEGFRPTAVARRLGLSRTTVWRRLRRRDLSSRHVPR